MKKKHLTELFLFIFSVELVGAVSGLLAGNRKHSGKIAVFAAGMGISLDVGIALCSHGLFGLSGRSFGLAESGRRPPI